MSESSRRRSQQNSQFKSIESEDDTRNPTTNKKIHGTPIQFKRTNPYLSAINYQDQQASYSRNRAFSPSQQLTFLQAKKCKYIKNKRYSKAQELDQQIRSTKSLMNKSKINTIISKQKQYKRSITVAHKKQIGHLNRVWDQYFYRFREREANILESFKQSQKQQIQRSREKLQRRCQSLKLNQSEIIELKKKEQYFIKIENYKDLSYIKEQMKKAKGKLRRQRESTIERWAELQQQKLCVIQSKKYEALISRLEQYRSDKEKIYLREQKRLRQKYKNVLVQLQHEQIMEINYVRNLLDFEKH